MTFLAPWAGWFLAGVPVIVLLYLLKLKRRPVTVSTLLFWQRVLQENRRRALFQKLRHLFSLLLHLLIFLLIVGALAKPALDRLVRAGASVVLIVDTRARMQADENGSSRFTQTLQQARLFARNASAQQQIAILEAGSAPKVTVPFTGDERDLLNGIEGLHVTDATGDLHSAIDLANSLLASRKGDSRILVLTDQKQANTKLASNHQLDFLPVGKPHDNVAITRFATRPLLSSPQTSEVLLSLKNFGAAPVSGNVELTFDGHLLDVKPFHLEAGGESISVFPSVPRPGRNARGWLIAKLDIKDALSLDNVAYAVLPTPRPTRVMLVTKGNWFLEKLLAADQQVEFELIEPSGWNSTLGEKFDVVVLDGFLPVDFDMAAARGNFLFLKQTPFTKNGDPVEQPIVTDLDNAHPALRFVNLNNITIVRALPAQLPQGDAGWTFQAPLKAFDLPLMITGTRAGNRGEQRLAAFAFDVAESDLPLRIAFPLLISNTIHWLGGETHETQRSYVAGESIELGNDQSVSAEPETDPGKALEAKVTSSTGFTQPIRNGFYRINDATGIHWIAVNTFADGESDLRDEPKDSRPAPARLVAPAIAGIGSWPLWQHLAFAAFILFTLEWWLFHRRRTE